MPPVPDPRWSHILGGLTPDGKQIPMSFDILYELTTQWSGLLTEPIPEGVARLLRMARSLFAHSWFGYEFMALATTVSLQAVEATFRQVVYPSDPPHVAFRT